MSAPNNTSYTPPRVLQEGDRVYMTKGHYKKATATVMRTTAQKMEVYLHDDKYNGALAVVMQSSGVYIPKPYEDPVVATMPPEVKPPRREKARSPTAPRNAPGKDQFAILEEEIDQMQSRLSMMKLVVAQMGAKNKVKPPHRRG
eukprot:CAMPEP_0172420026 /NCGR_PEP_ID=MMETSP1064-20121228/6418_1 /TAXON_ID=202472 /ORGANISM="Aulacoseira subarctica , Strain CCAP 1002/5" /LENGTH=143 /DNA_ID=CAMNT_0013159775 /DNA_START=336 /DNA_END=767 /DNA_ORIENTATION=+